METKTYYAIKHKPSGGFLPQGLRNRGFTHNEPSTHDPPRLFTNTKGAKCALTWWLKGETIQEWAYDDYEIMTSRKENRKSEEMEIVEILVSEANNENM